MREKELLILRSYKSDIKHNLLLIKEKKKQTASKESVEIYFNKSALETADSEISKL